MAGPTWLTQLGWGCADAFVAPAWSPACIAQRNVGAEECTTPVLLLQDYRRSDSAHSATRPVSLSTWLALHQIWRLHIWRRLGHTFLLQPITTVPMLTKMFSKAPEAHMLIVSSADESLSAVHLAVPALAPGALLHPAAAWSDT